MSKCIVSFRYGSVFSTKIEGEAAATSPAHASVIYTSSTNTTVCPESDSRLDMCNPFTGMGKDALKQESKKKENYDGDQ